MLHVVRAQPPEPSRKSQGIDLDLIIVEIFTIRELAWMNQYPTQYLDKAALPEIIKSIVRKGGLARRLDTMQRNIEASFRAAEMARWGAEGQKWMP